MPGARREPAAAAADGRGVLLERSDQLAALGASLDGVVAEGAGALVLVRGEAGVGKTVLLQAFCDERRASARVLWGACEALLTPGPLGPLFDVAELTRGALEELVSSGATPHEVTAALVRELAHGRATVLVLEDLHWADEATLDVLRLLARKVQTVPALVLVSYRDDELDRAHPLRVVLGELATARRGDPARGPAALARRRRRAGRAPRGRRGGPLPPDQRQPVLRHRGARGGHDGDPAHRARGGAGADGAPLGPRDAAAGGDRDRHAAGRGLVPRGDRPRRARPSGGMPGFGHGRLAGRWRVVPPRARTAGRRGVAAAQPPGLASSRRGRCTGRGARPRRRRRPDRPSRRRRRRRRRGAALRAGGRGAGGLARRPPRGRGPVRARAALRRGAAGAGAGGAAGEPRLRGLSHRRARRGDRGAGAGARASARARRRAARGRLPALALAPVSLRGAHRRRRRHGPPGRGQPGAAAARARAGAGLRQPRASLHDRRGRRGGRGLEHEGARARPSSSTIRRSSSTR